VKNLVVPLDGSAAAERGLEHGAALARQLDAHLVVVTHRSGGVVVDPLGYLAARAAAAGCPGAECRHLNEGYPAAAVAELADGLPDAVVVMSTRGHGRLSGAWLGSVAEQIVRLAAAPTVLIGPSSRPPAVRVQQVIVAAGATPPQAEVLRALGRCCEQLDAPLRVLHVVAPSAGSDDIERVRTQLAAAWASPSTATPAAAGRGGPRGGSSWPALPRVSVVRGGDVAETVSAFAGAQPGALVVVVTSAPTGLERLRRGSVGSEVVRRAHGPVLLLRTPMSADAAAG
jgi:nucleotide-binding universal stress UspA family protein